MKISVLVCTRNRVASLERTLRALLVQPRDGANDYEVTVVDNASTDGTRQLLDTLSREHAHLRYFYEPQPGLSYARNTGLRQTQSELVAFTDDDVLVAENWLTEIRREFVADPYLQLLGGRVLLARAGLQQIGMLDSTERRVIRYPNIGDEAIGANMAFRRRLFDEIGLFDVRLGAGRFFAGGEDTEFFYRALKAGHYLLYAPEVLVYHDHERETPEQACRLAYGFGKGFAAYLLKHALRGDRYAAQAIYWSARRAPARWQRQPTDSAESLARRRAHVRGLAAGLLTAPWVMGWGDGQTRC